MIFIGKSMVSRRWGCVKSYYYQCWGEHYHKSQLYINVNKRATFGLDPKPGNNSVGNLWRKKCGEIVSGREVNFMLRQTSY